MKKYLSLLFVAILVINLLPVSGIAEGTPQYAVEDKTVQVGDTFTMDVEIAENPGIISLRFKVVYDTSVLELQSVEDKGLLNGFTTPAPTITSPYTLRWADSLATTDNTAQGTVVTLTFKALQVTPSTTVTIEHSEARNSTGTKVTFTNASAAVTVDEKPVAATAIALNKETLTLKVGESETLIATLTPENTTDTVVWTSSDDKIASVDANGKVTALTEGNATITATAGDVSAICEVTTECAHINTTEHPAVVSTCTEQGNDAYTTCDDCDRVISGSAEKLPLDPTNHVDTTTYPDETGSCVDPGHAEYSFCNDCKSVISGSDSPVIGPHGNYVEKAEEKYLKTAADCDEAAVYYKSCELCGEAHATETFTYGEALGHDYGSATCTAPKTCKVCGTTDGEALGHSFTNYVSNNDATCTADGTKTATCDRCDATDTVVDAGSAKGHDYADATCTAPKTCKVCGATEGEALGHSYAIVWSKGEDGHWHECSACGDKANFAAHDYGTEGDTCLICGYERAHVHRLTLVPGVDATCTEGGSKAYYTCSGCEDWFEDASGTVVIVDKTSVAIAALGHDMSDATCTEASYCQREGCEYTEGSALGHNYEVGWTYDAESHWHKCSRCDAKTGEEAHTPGAEATEETAQTCTICGYEITPALGHMHKLTKVDATVTCTEAGHKAYYICECGKWFVDAAGTVEITDKNSVLSEALGHMDADDDNKCDVCDAILGAEQPNTPDTPDDVPQTGDNSKTVLWTTALILSFAGLILCVLLRKKRYVA